jgi:RND superfamily putative drug exporter
MQVTAKRRPAEASGQHHEEEAMSTFLYRLARWSYRHRRRVLAAWLVVAAAVVTLGVLSHGQENDNITIPGTESQNVVTLLQHKIPAYSGAQTQVVLVSRGSQSVTSSSYTSAIEAAVRQMGRVPQVAEVTDPEKTVSPDGKAAIATVLWKVSAGSVNNSSISALQTAAGPAQQAGLRVAYGGQVYPDWNPKVSELPEIIGLAIAFVILLVTFGAFAAAGMPILSAIIGVLITVTGITALAAVFSIATVSTTVAIMLGLSTGIDYGLFILSRHRAQLLAGQPMEESIATAVGKAGSAVAFAAAIVIVALAGLSVTGIPLLRTMGLLAAGAVAISMLIALTLLPAILGFVGDKVARFIGSSRRPGRAERSARRAVTEPERTAGASWARFVVRFRWPVLLAGIGVVVVIALPALRLNLGLPDGASQPTSSTARQAYDLTSDHFGPGFNGALLVVASPVTSQQDAQAITGRLAKVPDVLTASPAADQNQTAVIQVIPKTGPDASATTSLVNRIRGERAQLAGSTGTQLLVGGPTASNIDVSKKLSSALPLFLVVVVGLALLLLTFAFRTILVPAKSILGFLLSVAAALGAEVALFQWGWAASLLGVTKSQVTLSFLPIVLIAIIFGLSSDYELFVVSRIKEDFTKTGDARGAVRRGTGVSVRLVSAAALIMFSIFVAFMSTNNVDVRPIAFSFAVGVAIDAFVVRLTLVLAVMAIVGSKMWYHPKWFGRYVPDPDIDGDRLDQRLAAQQPVPALATASKD